MSTRFRCYKCKAGLCSDDKPGTTLQCPKCLTVVTVPAVSEAPKSRAPRPQSTGSPVWPGIALALSALLCVAGVIVYFAVPEAAEPEEQETQSIADANRTTV